MANKQELKDILDERGVEYDEDLKKDELQDLVDETAPEEEEVEEEEVEEEDPAPTKEEKEDVDEVPTNGNKFSIEKGEKGEYPVYGIISKQVQIRNTDRFRIEKSYGLVRTYTDKIHGKNAKELAKTFVEKANQKLKEAKEAKA